MSVPSPDELHQRLLEQVSELRTSEEWLAAMVTAARFHDYSLGNWLLLWCQAEERGTKVTRPAGYRMWQRLGRQVRRGERGYRILAPLTRRLLEEDGDEEARVVVTGFRVVTVFDVDQTDGEPLPEAVPTLLSGGGYADLLAGAVGMIEEQGYSFRLGRFPGPNGVTDPARRQVIVSEDLGDAQAAKTAVHELAHVLMHADTTPIDCRERIEVEAESVACVVCGAAGLDTAPYSVAYVAGWAEANDNPGAVLLSTAERVVITARAILSRLSPRASIALDETA